MSNPSAVFKNNVTITGDLDISQSTIDVSNISVGNNLDVSNELDVTGAAVFKNNVTITGDLDISQSIIDVSNISVGNNLDVSNDLLVSGTLTSTNIIAKDQLEFGEVPGGSSKLEDAMMVLNAGNAFSNTGIHFRTAGSASIPPKTAIITEGIGSSHRGKLHFCIQNSDGTTASDIATLSNSKMSINYLGNVGIGLGETNPNATFEVSGNAIIQQDTQVGSLTSNGDITTSTNVDASGSITAGSFSTSSSVSAASITASESITGNVTGNLTGNVTGDVTGNATSATKLETARTIAGASFDGTVNVDILSTNLSDSGTLMYNNADQTLNDSSLTVKKDSQSSSNPGLLVKPVSLSSQDSVVEIRGARSGSVINHQAQLIFSNYDSDTHTSSELGTIYGTVTDKDANTGKLVLDSNSQVDININSTNIVYITGSGLDVNGDISGSGNATINGTLTIGSMTTDVESYITDISSNLANLSQDKIESGTTSVTTTSANNIEFNISGSQSMIINSAGNVGIGTTATSGYILDVANQNARFQGSVEFNKGIYVTDNDETSTADSTWAGLTFNTTNNKDINLLYSVSGNSKYDLFYQNSTGYFALNSKSGTPGRVFTANKTTSFTITPDTIIDGTLTIGSMTTDVESYITDISSNLANLSQDKIESGTTSVTTTSANNIEFNISGSQSMIINSAGNVGIGTTTGPSSKLDVNGTIRSGYNTDTTSYFGRTAIGYGGDYTDMAFFSHIDYNNSDDFALIQNNNGKTILNSNSTESTSFRIGNIEKMSLDSTGKVTATSFSGNGSSLTDVTATSCTGNAATVTNGVYTNTAFTLASNVNSGLHGIIGDYNNNTSSNESYIRFIAQNSHSSYVLYFNTMSANNNRAKSAIWIEGQGDTDYGRNKMHFCVNNSTDTNYVSLTDAVMTLIPSGNVGIGTTEPNSKLEVVGDISGSGTITATTSFSGPGTDLTGTASGLTAGAASTVWVNYGGNTFNDNTCFIPILQFGDSRYQTIRAKGTITFNAGSDTLFASNLSGNGANITSLNADNISSGTLSVDSIPDLDASKITGGTLAAARGGTGLAPASGDANKYLIVNGSGNGYTFGTVDALAADSDGNFALKTSDTAVTTLQIGDSPNPDQSSTFTTYGDEAVIINKSTKYVNNTGPDITSIDSDMLYLTRDGYLNQSYNIGARFKLDRSEHVSTLDSNSRLTFNLADNEYFKDSNNVMSLLSSGKVGIGTTDPSSTLEINVNGQTSSNPGLLVKSDSDGNDAVVEIRGQRNASLSSNHAQLIFSNKDSHRTSVERDILGTIYGQVTNTTTNEGKLVLDSNIIEMNGNVGIGTANPSGLLHIYEATGTAAAANGGGTLVLEHGDLNGTSSISFKSRNNSANDYAAIQYTSNSTGDTSKEYGVLTIKCENDTTGGTEDEIRFRTSGSDRVIINGNGSVIIGSPSGTYNTSTNNNQNIDLTKPQLSVGGGNQDTFQTNKRLYGGTDNATITDYISLFVDGNMVIDGTLHNFSDERIKQNVQCIHNSLDKIRNLRPVSFTRKKQNEKQFGFIAQEVEKVIPYAVTKIKDFMSNIMDFADVSGNIIKVKNIYLYELNIQDNELKEKYALLKIHTSSERVLYTKVISIDYERSELVLENTLDLLDNEENEVFLYGSYTEDFRKLNTDYIWTITTSALKEIDIIQVENMKRINNQQATIETQLVTIDNQQATINNLQTKVASMESLIESLSSRLNALENV